MTAILKAMQEQQAETRKKLRAEFFGLATKPKPTPKDLARLADVAEELGWDDKIIRIIDAVLRTAESFEAELKKPCPTAQEVADWSAELTKLIDDFNELAKEHDKASEALARRICAAGQFQAAQQQNRQQLANIREKFAPIFGTGDKWGSVDDGIGGPLYDYLGFLRRHDPENAATRHSPSSADAMPCGRLAQGVA